MYRVDVCVRCTARGTKSGPLFCRTKVTRKVLRASQVRTGCHMRYKHIHAHTPKHWTSVRSSRRPSVHAVHSSVQIVRPSAVCGERGQDRMWCVKDSVRSREPSQCHHALDSWMQVPAAHYSSVAGHILWQKQRRQAPPHGECGGVGVRRAIYLGLHSLLLLFLASGPCQSQRLPGGVARWRQKHSRKAYP